MGLNYLMYFFFLFGGFSHAETTQFVTEIEKENIEQAVYFATVSYNSSMEIYSRAMMANYQCVLRSPEQKRALWERQFQASQELKQAEEKLREAIKKCQAIHCQAKIDESIFDRYSKAADYQTNEEKDNPYLVDSLSNSQWEILNNYDY